MEKRKQKMDNPIVTEIMLKRVRSDRLKPRQKENYNFQKLSAVLADYGFSTLRLTDDWHGADFIAQHVDGRTFLKVQLKARLVFYRKYMRKNLYVAFPYKNSWYLYPHDIVLRLVLRGRRIVGSTKSWRGKGGYSFRTLTKNLTEVLEPYKLGGSVMRLRRDV